MKNCNSLKVVWWVVWSLRKEKLLL
jgi:hypothetical protein